MSRLVLSCSLGSFPSFTLLFLQERAVYVKEQKRIFCHLFKQLRWRGGILAEFKCNQNTYFPGLSKDMVQKKSMYYMWGFDLTILFQKFLWSYQILLNFICNSSKRTIYFEKGVTDELDPDLLKFGICLSFETELHWWRL